MSRFIIFCFLFSIPFSLSCQQKIAGIPLSFSDEFQDQFNINIPVFEVKKIDEQSIENKKKQPNNNRNFTIPIKTDIELGNTGKWTELGHGNRLWQLQLTVKKAKGLVLMYDNFYLPKGSKLFVYSADRKQILGTYTSQNNNKSRKFLTGIIKGESAIVEYYEPAKSRGMGDFRIFRIDYAYENTFATSDHPFQQMSGNNLGFEASTDCQIDINCAEGNDLKEIQRGICRIMMVLEEGIGWCTGNLMNTSANDGTPLVLSAYHCFDGYTPLFDLWRFDFNYEHPNCEATTIEPEFQSLLGCQFRAGWNESDFVLIEIDKTIPTTYNAYFNAWDVRESIPTNTRFIHHPRADVKKLTLDKDQPIIFSAPISWNNDLVTPANHHFRVTMNEGGGFEIGSSGGALFDNNKRIVGQLHGGFPDSLCRASTAYFARLFISWEGNNSSTTRLKDWLDPLNTGTFRVDGIENPVEETFVSVQGNIATPDGKKVANVSLFLGDQLVTTTDLAGNYLLESMKVGDTFTLRPFKNDNFANGTSVLDLIAMQKHNLGITSFESIYQMIAADTDNSQRISIFDLVQLQKVILGRDSDFPNNTSWRFIPNSFEPNLQNFDFNFPESVSVEILSSNLNFDFTAIKVGDVNASADPSQ